MQLQTPEWGVCDVCLSGNTKDPIDPGDMYILLYTHE